MRSLDIYNSALSTCLSGARPDLSPEDNIIVHALAECPPRPYAELIKSDIPGPSSSRSARSTVLRPSPPSTMKVSPIGPSTAKPTKGELLVRVEALSRKSRSLKRKTLDSVEKDQPAWGKVPKLGTSSSSPSTHVRTSGKCCRLRLRSLKLRVRNPVLGPLQRQKSPLGGLSSSRWRSCPSQFGILLCKALSHLPRGRKS